MPRRLIALAIVLAGANTAIADDMKMPINSGDLKWGPAPPTFAEGSGNHRSLRRPVQRWSLRSSPKNAERL